MSAPKKDRPPAAQDQPARADGRVVFPPGTMLNPVPAVMVSCGSMEAPNIITIAWTGTVCSEPPMTYISVRPSRHSYDIIRQAGEFTINLVDKGLAEAADYCGVKSGRQVDKFGQMKLTAIPGRQVSCPSIAQAPASIECRVKQILPLGSHDMFLAEVVCVTAREDLMDEKGSLQLDRAGLIAYNHGHYYGLPKQELGRFGYSVMKPKTRRRYEAQRRAKSRQAVRMGKKQK